MEPDYYRILGAREDATEEEIKKSYWKVAKKYHPDSNPRDKDAEKRFKEAAEAYAVLGDAEKRRAYDKVRLQDHTAGPEQKRPDRNKKTSQTTASFDFNSMSSNFEQYFGFRPGTSQVDEEKLHTNKKIKTNPIDVTEMFERYMGIEK